MRTLKAEDEDQRAIYISLNALKQPGAVYINIGGMKLAVELVRLVDGEKAIQIVKRT